MPGLDNVLLAALATLALFLAWWLGRRSQQAPNRPPPEFSQDYFVGLNYLVNDEPDDAIDIFIRSLEGGQRSLEAHLALGALLRRRGKVDKAVSVYQSLLARPGLSRTQSSQVRLELARSYISAGLLDRAERLLEQLQHDSDEFRQTALSLAMHVYQMEKDWQQAAHAAQGLIKLSPVKQRSHLQLVTSHYYCELAEQHLTAGQYRQARQCLKKAGNFSRDNVRVSFLLGDMAIQQENYKEAIRHLSRVAVQNKDFYPEVFSRLLSCHQCLGSEKSLERFVSETLRSEAAASILLTISETRRLEAGAEAALHFLLEQLRKKPSLLLMRAALLHLAELSEEGRREYSLLFHHVLDDFLQRVVSYQCHNCGFEGRSLHWLCPGCAQWGSIYPVKGIAGE